MRPIALVVPPLVSLWCLAACEPVPADKGGDSADSASDTGSTTEPQDSATHTGTAPDHTGGSTPTEPAGWTVVPLLDDGDIWHAGNDLVTGIHFASLDDGLVVTYQAGQNSVGGGAVFAARRAEVTSIAFAAPDARCSTGSVNFRGIAATDQGYVGLAHACDLVESTDGGRSFTLGASGFDAFGIETTLAWVPNAGRTQIVRASGVVSETATRPGPDTLWDDVWAPAGIPSVPNPLPPELCQDGPRGSTFPELPQAVWVAADGERMVYASVDDVGPQLCASDDAGHTFLPVALPGAPQRLLPPVGVTFPTPDVGLVWFANHGAVGGSYVYRSTDAGATWAPAELQGDLATLDMELRQMFFAPGGRVGFVVGFDYEHQASLLIKTTDGGATWARSGGDLARRVSDAGGAKLWSGFALDEDHLWVGGERGILAYDAAGGE